MDNNQNGIVYVLINEAMPGLVKVGCTTDLKQRLKTLDTTNMPEPFECLYAVTVTDMRRIENLIHQVFGDRRIRPNREFFKVDTDQVVAALKLAGNNDVTPRPEDYIEDAGDRERLNETQERREKFNFKMLGIPIGSKLVFANDRDIYCTVSDNTHVEFDGIIMSLSAATQTVQELPYSRHGALFWLFEDELLIDRRLRMEHEQDGKLKDE